MAGTGPQVAKTPLELLNNQATADIPFLVQHMSTITGSVVGLLAAIGANWGTRRPILSGVHRYILIIGAFGSIGAYLEQRRSVHLAKRDAIFRHYIELHPDEFPPYERKQFKDVLEPWAPIR